MKLAAVFLVLLITMFYLITITECNDLKKLGKKLELEAKKLGDQIEKEGKRAEKKLKENIKNAENDIKKEKERFIEKEKQNLIDKFDKKIEKEKAKLKELNEKVKNDDIEEVVGQLQQEGITNISIEDVQTVQEIAEKIEIIETIGKAAKDDLDKSLAHKKQGDLITLNQPYLIEPGEKFIFLYQDLIPEHEKSIDYIELVPVEFESESLRYTVSKDGVSGVALSKGTYDINITLKVYPSNQNSKFKTCYGVLNLQVEDISESKSEKSENATKESTDIKLSWFEFICIVIIATLLIPSCYVAYKIIYRCNKQKQTQKTIDVKQDNVEELEEMYKVTDCTTDDELEEESEKNNQVV